MTGDPNGYVLTLVYGGPPNAPWGPFGIGWAGISGGNGQNILTNAYSQTQSCSGGGGGGEGAGGPSILASQVGKDATVQSGGGGGGACALAGAGGFAGGHGSRGWIKIEEYAGALSTN